MYKLKLKSIISVSSETYSFEEFSDLVKYAKNPKLDEWYVGGNYNVIIGKDGTDNHVIFSYDKRTHRFYYRSFHLDKWINVPTKNLQCFTEIFIKRGY